MQDLAEDAGGLESGEAREVDRGFGMPGAAEHAAFLRPERKDMAGLDEIVRPGLRPRQGANGRGPVVRADAGGDAFGRVDRDREIGPVHFAVLRDHALEAEFISALAHDRHADEPAAVHGHEIDCRRRRFLRGHDEVALVFAVGVVGHDHDFPRRDIAQHVVNRVELKGFRRLDDHPLTIAVAPALGKREFTSRSTRRSLSAGKGRDCCPGIQP